MDLWVHKLFFETAVRGTEIDKWLRELNVGRLRRNNYREIIHRLIRFAISRKYLPKDFDEMDAVPVVKVASSEIEIFKPEEMIELLRHAHSTLIPFLTIGGFAGIRHAEIQRLNWRDVDLEAKIIEVRAINAKTASRRIVPVSDNLRAWLKPHHLPEGRICHHSNMSQALRILIRDINQSRRLVWAKEKGVDAITLAETEMQVKRQRPFGARAQMSEDQDGNMSPGAETAAQEGWAPFSWKHNAMRHSYISYRVADTQNVAQVALEAGNSPRMIFKHYREVVRPDAAKAWFSILPADGLKKAEAGTA